MVLFKKLQDFVMVIHWWYVKHLVDAEMLCL